MQLSVSLSVSYDCKELYYEGTVIPCVVTEVGTAWEKKVGVISYTRSNLLNKSYGSFKGVMAVKRTLYKVVFDFMGHHELLFVQGWGENIEVEARRVDSLGRIQTTMKDIVFSDYPEKPVLTLDLPDYSKLEGGILTEQGKRVEENYKHFTLGKHTYYHSDLVPMTEEEIEAAFLANYPNWVEARWDEESPTSLVVDGEYINFSKVGNTNCLTKVVTKEVRPWKARRSSGVVYIVLVHPDCTIEYKEPEQAPTMDSLASIARFTRKR